MPNSSCWCDELITSPSLFFLVPTFEVGRFTSQNYQQCNVQMAQSFFKGWFLAHDYRTKVEQLVPKLSQSCLCSSKFCGGREELGLTGTFLENVSSLKHNAVKFAVKNELKIRNGREWPNSKQIRPNFFYSVPKFLAESLHTSATCAACINYCNHKWLEDAQKSNKIYKS